MLVSSILLQQNDLTFIISACFSSVYFNHFSVAFLGADNLLSFLRQRLYFFLVEGTRDGKWEEQNYADKKNKIKSMLNYDKKKKEWWKQDQD